MRVRALYHDLHQKRITLRARAEGAHVRYRTHIVQNECVNTPQYRNSGMQRVCAHLLRYWPHSLRACAFVCAAFVTGSTTRRARTRQAQVHLLRARRVQPQLLHDSPWLALFLVFRLARAPAASDLVRVRVCACVCELNTILSVCVTREHAGLYGTVCASAASALAGQQSCSRKRAGSATTTF